MIIAIIILAGAYASYGKYFRNDRGYNANGLCSIDTDCIPDSCCHSSGCVLKNNSPTCEGSICSQVCVPGSLDCGQASCKCVNKKCSVVKNEGN